LAILTVNVGFSIADEVTDSTAEREDGGSTHVEYGSENRLELRVSLRGVVGGESNNKCEVDRCVANGERVV
jgi:hypothetical protein